jgi:hypothetical protein
MSEVVSRGVRNIAREFNLSETYQNWEKPVKVSLLDKFVLSIRQSIENIELSLQSFSPIVQALGETKTDKIKYFQIDDLVKLGIVAYDEDDTIQLKIDWLGDEQVNIILFEDDEPIQQEMKTAEFFFEPSQTHIIVIQDTTGKELFRLPLGEIE